FVEQGMPSEQPAETAEGMAGNRMCSRVSRSRRVTPLPPTEKQPRNDHDQCHLQHQAEERSKAAHAANKSMPKQQAEQARTKEAAGKTAEQPATKETRRCRRAAGRVGVPRLRECTLHRRG